MEDGPVEMVPVPTRLKTSCFWVSLTSNTRAGPADSPVALTVTGLDEKTKLKLIASARAAAEYETRSARHPKARVAFFMILSILRGRGRLGSAPAPLAFLPSTLRTAAA